MAGDIRRAQVFRKQVQGLLLALLFLAPLWLGASQLTPRVICFTASAVALLVLLFKRRAIGKRFPATIPLLALATTFVVTALQLVPLPAGVLATLSPRAHETFQATLGEYTWHPLTLDVAGTLSGLAKIGGYLAFFAAATIAASRSLVRRRLIMAVVAVATLQALIGFAQAAIDPTRIFFFYLPEQQILNDVFVRGTFVNPNHFGALMCIAAPCALVLGLRDRRLRVPAFAAIIVINVAVVLSLSRAALITAPIAQAVTFGLDRWAQLRGAREAERGGGRRVLVAILILAALATTVALAASRIGPVLVATEKSELTNPLGDQHSKFYLWGEAADVIRAYPWTGAGRGAFEQAFTQISESAGQVRTQWVENAYLQAITDWGLPIAVLLFGLAAWTLVTVLRNFHQDPLAAGPCGAILALMLHECADFSVELPGVAYPALALLATLFGRRGAEARGIQIRLPIRVPHMLAGVAVAALALATLFVPTASADAKELVRLVRDPDVPTSEVLAAGKPMQERHPADYYITALVAERLARERHPETMKWLNDAIYLNPSHPTLHVIAAELLASAGRKAQALLEFRTALEMAREPSRIFQRIADNYPAHADLLAGTPDDTRLQTALGDWLWTQQRYADADAVYGVVLEADPNHLAARHQRVRLALSRGNGSQARSDVEALLSVDRSGATQELAVEADLLVGDLEGAARRMDAFREHSSRAVELEIRLAQALSRAGHPERARKRLEKVTWPVERLYKIRLHEVRAEIERQAGNEHQYEWEMEQASRLRSR